MGKKIAPYMVFVEEYARKNRIDRNSAFTVAGSLWKEMDEEARKPYKEEAASRTSGKRGRPLDIPISRGEPSQAMNEQRETNYMSHIREQWSEDFVSQCESRAEMLEKPIFIISFNVMCKDPDGEFIPIEIGLIRYTFKDGITFEYHRFISASEIPLGMAFEAKEHMMATHQIPIDAFTLDGKAHGLGSVQIEDVVSDLDTIIKVDRLFQSDNDTKGVRPIFAFPDDDDVELEQCRSCLRYMGKKANKPEFASSIEVLDIARLISAIFTKCKKPHPYGCCLDKVSSATFDYSPNTMCSFHEEKDCKHCALAKVKRLSYMLSNALCSFLNVRLTNSHLPLSEEPTVAFEDLEKFNLREGSSSNKRRYFDDESTTSALPLRNTADPDISEVRSLTLENASTSSSSVLNELDEESSGAEEVLGPKKAEIKPRPIGIGRGRARLH